MDYTKARLGSKPDGERKIILCPVCGKKGLPRIYKGDRKPFGVVFHKSESLYGLEHIRESCPLTREQAASVKEGPES